MLALKKKREKEKKEAEEAAKREAAAAAESPAEAPSGEGGQVSLFGIGGQKKSKKGEAEKTKKSPGEIRIQKGKFWFPSISHQSPHTHIHTRLTSNPCHYITIIVCKILESWMVER